MQRPPASKPDRAGSSPATAGIGAGRGCLGVVRGCPLETGQDCCEWHASGTASEGDLARRVQLAPSLNRRVRAVLGDHRIVAKPRTRRGSVFRSCLASDASGAPVLRDQGPIGRPGTARPMSAEGSALCEGVGSVLAADLSAEEVVHGRLGCPGVGLRVQVRHGDELAVGVVGAEGGRPVARQRPAVPQSSVAHPGRSSVRPRP
jgi:hypothetical protein